MKKLFVLLSCCTLAASISACSIPQMGTENSTGGSSSGTVNVSTDSDKGEDKKDLFNSDKVLNSLETTSYTWESGSYHYLALIVKNNSNFDCQLSANVTFKNTDGQTIGADDGYLYALGKNTEACMVLSNKEAFSSFDYSYEAEKMEYYKCTTSAITCESSATSDKALLTFTNNGQETVGALSYIVLFFQGDRVVYDSWGLESDISAGKTFTKEANYYNSKDDFDSVKVYYTGYSPK